MINASFIIMISQRIVKGQYGIMGGVYKGCQLYLFKTKADMPEYWDLTSEWWVHVCFYDAVLYF